MTDTHFTRSAPKYRAPGFFEQQMAKWAEVFEIAKENDVDFVLHGGDLYHTDDPEVAVIVEVMKRIDRDLYVTVGNHDFKSDQFDTLRLTALGLMEQAKYIHISHNDLEFEEGEYKILLRMSHYFEKDQGDNRFRLANGDRHHLRILVCHDALVNEPEKFKHILVDNVQSDFDLVLCGHYHYPFTRQVGDALFINPGSMTRLTRANRDMMRVPQVLLVDYTKGDLNYGLIELKSAVPWEKAFLTDEIAIAQAEEKQLGLAEDFMASVMDSAASVNVDEAIDAVAKEQQIEPQIVALCKNYMRKAAL